MSTSFQLQNNALKELPHNIEAEQGILGAILLKLIKINYAHLVQKYS